MLSDSVFEFRAALFHARHDGVAQLGHARGIHLWNALELIGNAQLLVLDDTHRVIRQHFQAHHVVPWSDQTTELLALLNRIGNARHHHVADNDLNLAARELITKRQNACGIATGQLFMLDGIGVFNVEQHHIGLVEYGIELLGMRGIKRIAAAIQAGVICGSRPEPLAVTISAGTSLRLR